MKYTIVINQAGISNGGLTDKTNLDDWAVLGYIADWLINHSATIRDGHVWINFKHLLAEMPLLRIKTKQGISDTIKKLKDLGLVTAIYDDEKRLYLKLTPLYHDTVTFQACPKNREGVRPDGQGVRPDGQGGVRPDGHSLDNHISIDNQDSFMSDFDQFWNAYGLKVAKPLAEKAFRNARKEASMEMILAGVSRYKASLVRTGYSQAHPASWLRAGRWLDETTNEADNGKDFRRGGAAPTKTDRLNAVLADAKANIAAGKTGFGWAEPDGGNSHAILPGPEPVRQGAGTTGGGYPTVSDGVIGLFD